MYIVESTWFKWQSCDKVTTDLGNSHDYLGNVHPKITILEKLLNCYSQLFGYHHSSKYIILCSGEEEKNMYRSDLRVGKYIEGGMICPFNYDMMHQMVD